MATVPTTKKSKLPDYPTSDGRPMAETDLHRDLMVDLIETLKTWYATDPMVYVSGNLLVFYEKGNRRRHVSPDVFVVKGVGNRRRDNYLIWEEGKSPDVVIELTSSSTRSEDMKTKYALYRDTLKIGEYFLFDPHGDYLVPNLQGYRLEQGTYVPIDVVGGRFPSEVLGLHLEQDRSVLRLYDPRTDQWLLTPEEKNAQDLIARQEAELARDEGERRRQQAEQARWQAEQAREQAEQARREAEKHLDLSEQARRDADAENERLRQELETLRRLSRPDP